jgi:hypothetical protein
MRTSALVHDQLGMYDNPAVVGPFSPRQKEDNNDGDDRHNTAASRANTGFVDGFCEGVEPCESRLGWHGGWKAGSRIEDRYRKGQDKPAPPNQWNAVRKQKSAEASRGSRTAKKQSKRKVNHQAKK